MSSWVVRSIHLSRTTFYVLRFTFFALLTFSVIKCLKQGIIEL